MKRQTTDIRAIAIVAAAVITALLVWTLATAAGSTSPPDLPTQTAPAPATEAYPGPDPYPGPYPGPEPYPAPYPAPVYLPVVEGGDAYP